MSNTLSVEDVPLNRFHKLLTVRSGGGSYVDGYVLSIIGIAMTKVSPALGFANSDNKCNAWSCGWRDG
ncbi:hypothetical protein [Erwinia sp. V71]|uniref:hypothetical protein n=1 Tax=Erwinia sp. V71 TaxID=3369424 RepID=UPI003F5E8CE8